MSTSRVECVVGFEVNTTVSGEAANAFRVMECSASEVFLDFCRYIPAENSATVVTRVRISREFLPMVGGRIQEAMQELGQPVELRDGLLVSRGGNLVLLGTPGGEQ